MPKQSVSINIHHVTQLRLDVVSRKDNFIVLSYGQEGSQTITLFFDNANDLEWTYDKLIDTKDKGTREINPDGKLCV